MFLDKIGQKISEQENKRGGTNSVMLSDLNKNVKKKDAASAFMNLMQFQKGGLIHMKNQLDGLKSKSKFSGQKMFKEILIYKHSTE